MVSQFLDASMEVIHSHTEGENNVYLVRLSFKDLFGRSRKHSGNVVFPATLSLSSRISFTAISSVGSKIGLVENVSDLHVRVMLHDRTVNLLHNRDFDLKRGDQVFVIERVHPTEHVVFETVVPVTVQCTEETLCLQSVNADLLDEQQGLVYRLSADPLLRGCHEQTYGVTQ